MDGCDRVSAGIVFIVRALQSHSHITKGNAFTVPLIALSYSILASGTSIGNLFFIGLEFGFFKENLLFIFTNKHSQEKKHATFDYNEIIN